MEAATQFDLEKTMGNLLNRCAIAGTVPVAWMWGPALRADFSEWLDTDGQKWDGRSFMETHAPLADDGSICIMCGLPVFPMVAEGMALRTVAKQIETGFD